MNRRKKLVMGAAAGGILLPLLELAQSGEVGIAVAIAFGLGVYMFGDEIEALSGGGETASEPNVSSSDGEVEPSKVAIAFLGKKRALEAAQRRAARRGQFGQEEEEIGQAGEPVFPQYRPDETLRLGQVIDKETLAKLIAAYQADPHKPLPKVGGCRFEPHINGLYGKGAIIAAVQGSGKSMLSGLFVEQCGECGGPAILFDHKGEYEGVAGLSSLYGLIAGGDLARRRAEKLGVPYFELTPQTAARFVKLVMTGFKQAVVMLPSYGSGLDWLPRAEVVAAVAKALMDYAAEILKSGGELLPCLVLLDEAQLYIPENKNLLPPEARENPKVLGALANAFFALVSSGRSNGYTMCFATQSLTYIAKWAIKSCQIRVIMRHVEHNDLDTIDNMIKPSGVVTREDMELLPPGVGVVWGFTPRPMVVQFDRRQSEDKSETPGVERLRQSQEPEPPVGRNTVKVVDLTLEDLMTLLGRATTGAGEAAAPNGQDEADEEKATEELSPVVQPVVAEKPYKRRMAKDIDLKIAIAVWNAGCNSRRKLAAAFDIAPNQAEHLMEWMGVKEDVKEEEQPVG